MSQLPSRPRRSTRFMLHAASGALALGFMAVAGSASAQSTCNSGTHLNGGSPVVNGDDFDNTQTGCGGGSDVRQGSYNTALGFASSAALGQGHTAVGSGAFANGTNSFAPAETRGNTAVGSSANAGGNDSLNIALGADAAAFGSNSANIAIGARASAIGDGASRIAIGDESGATGNNAVSLGYNAEASGDFSVALGAGAVADQDNVISVGSVGNRRRIINLGDGAVSANSFDAVNGRQLFTTNTRISTLEAGAGSALAVANTAQNTADVALALADSAVTVGLSAQTLANAAQSTADTALVNAATAQSTADLARAEAATAQGTANTALVNAAVAQSTADIARTEAAAAQGTADTARVEAATAQQTADTAILRGDEMGDSVAQALGGGATYDVGTATITAPTYTIGTTAYSNVGAAFEAINTTGARYFHTDGSLPDSAATGVGSTAIAGGALASGSRSLAVGPGSEASGASSTAMGDGARATESGTIAVGLNSTASGVNATGIGTGSSATADNSVALGSGSVADQANTVSVGSASNARRIVNVAAGTSPSDAANMAQLGASGASVASALGGGATANAAGVVSAPSYALYSGTFDNVGSALEGLSNFQLESRREARRGIAAAIAMSSAPMPSQPGKTSWVVNTAEFSGAVAFGGSVAHRFNTEKPFAFTAGYSFGARENAFRVGFAGEF